MTKHLQRLESKGFIRCAPSTADRRYKKVSCTEQSSGIHNMILEQDGEVFAELCRTLTEPQRLELVQLADMILENLDAE